MQNCRITTYLIFLLLPLCLFGSCASLNNKGVGRIKKYEFSSKDVPASFDHFKVGFLSDFHYKSLFTGKRLKKLVKTVNKLDVDLLLLGGDYHAGCRYVPELFSELSTIQTTHGTVAVMGNHDYYACYEEIVDCMKENGIRLLEHQSDTIRQKGEQIIIAGVRNPFDLKANGHSPTLDLKASDFVILLVHTPDYVEDVPVTHTDLALAGHTHGGQVTLFGLYAPQTNSHYGQRFRTGLKYNSAGTPVIITNGIGTSRKKIRLFAPAEIVLITLRVM